MAKRNAPDFKAIDRLVRALPAPPKGNKVFKEPELRTLGLTGPWLTGLAPRVTAAGARAWTLGYRAGGIERRYTIGDIEAWPAEKVWPEAARLRRIVDAGGDPMAERHAERAAPTVNDLADRFEAEHLLKKRATTQRDYEGILNRYIRPQLVL